MNFFVLFLLVPFFTLAQTKQEQTAYAQLSAIFQEAKDSFGNREFAKSAQLFEKLGKLIPEWPDNYANWARAELEAGNPQKAINVYRKGVKKFPDSAAVHLGFCQGISEMVNRQQDFRNVKLPLLAEATNVCVKATTLSPDDPQALQTLAAALTLFMDYKTAIQAYEQWLIRFHSSHPAMKFHVLKNLGAALIRSGNNKRALEVANELMDLDPSAENIGFVAHIRSIAFPMDTDAGNLKLKGLIQEVSEYTLHHPLVCGKEGKWRVALNYSEEAITNPDFVRVEFLNPESAYKSYGSVDDPVFVGKPLVLQPGFYHERIINLVFFKNVFMSGHNGIVHGDCVLYTGSHHAAVDLQTFSKDDNVPIKTINHPTVSIIGHQLMNYYHWIMESLPKLLLLQHHILNTPEYKTTKILIPPPGTSRAIDETLSLPHFDSIRNRFIYYENPTRQRYHFPKGLILLDWIHHSQDTHKTLHNNLWSVYWPPQHALKVTRSFFHQHLEALPSRNIQQYKIVYISRAGKLRDFPNEKELITYLRMRFGDLIKVHTGNEGLIEQAEMFYGARVVVGNHGAGLTNYLYTREGAVVVMVPMDPHVEFCFSHLVAAFGGRHYIVTEIPGSHYYGTYGAISRDHMALLGDTIEKALNEVLERDSHNMVKDEVTGIDDDDGSVRDEL
ncbi:UNVERIFIED_CONTAM: hypothetical protein HDU68_010635 [Siphonaria sp. JEL0065]|nr:hypothetical protein HDU68_010635 [Siphonaria sp. JEL0065]